MLLSNSQRSSNHFTLTNTKNITAMTVAATMVALLMAPTNNVVHVVVHGMPANPIANTFREVQPHVTGDHGQGYSTTIQLQLHGNPHDGTWMSDEDDYTVLRDPITKQFVYAEEDGKGGLRPSSELVMGQYQKHHQQSSPAMVSSSLSIKKQKRLRPTKRDCLNKICGEHDYYKGNDNDDDANRRSLGGNDNNSYSNSTAIAIANTTINDDSREEISRRTLASATGRGRLRNLVLLLQWSDHKERILPTREQYDILMNHNGPYSSRLAPTGSVRDVFLENSYGALNVESYVTDWIPMDNTEEYYANGEKGMTTRIHDAIRHALEYVDANKEQRMPSKKKHDKDNNDDDNDSIDFDYFDEDQDGNIDSVTFIHSGYPAEAGGSDSYGRFFEDRIWSHKWGLYEPFQSKTTSTQTTKKGGRSTTGGGVRVSMYHISSGLWGLSGSEIGRIGVIAHEMAHFLGLPDLYDTDSSSAGLGNYCTMANSWGSNGQQTHVPSMSAWAKMQLGWVTPVEVVIGTNIVEAAAIQNPVHPQVYIIQEGFPEGEFLLIENRQPIGFDMLLPQGGLAIWHIDYGSSGKYKMYDVYDAQSNEGHPIQVDWPENGKHYAIALLQADGYYDLETGFNQGDYGDLFHANGTINELVPCRNPQECQHPNTDAYQGGRISRTNIHITEISVSRTVMSFHYAVGEFGSVLTSTPSTSTTINPISLPTATPTTNQGKGRGGSRGGSGYINYSNINNNVTESLDAVVMSVLVAAILVVLTTSVLVLYYRSKNRNGLPAGVSVEGDGVALPVPVFAW